MNQRIRLLIYLLLNVFVSACVTLAILYWYDRTNRYIPSPSDIIPDNGLSSGSLPSDLSLTPGTDPQIEISSVIGAGMLDAEIVLIKHSGPGEISLTGWRLQDSGGNVFTFPALTLYSNGAVQVHTSAGTNTVVDLYWGRSQAVWQSGEIATLLDAKSNIRAIYRVP